MKLMNASQRMSEKAICTTSVTIVDADADSAEALQALIAALPGIASVLTVTTFEAALAQLAGNAEVQAYAAPAAHVQQVVLIELADMPGDETLARETIAKLRAASPGLAVVMLCVYPEHSRGPVCGLADICLPKDTSPAELRALLLGLRAH